MHEWGKEQEEDREKEIAGKSVSDKKTSMKILHLSHFGQLHGYDVSTDEN